MAHHLPPLDCWPLGRGARLVWWWATSPQTNGGPVDSQAVAKSWDRLWVPPPGVEPDPDGPWGQNAIQQQFSRARNGLGL